MKSRLNPYTENWTEQFEKEFCEYIGGIKAWSVKSGSSALTIALKALKIRSVWVTDNTCPKVFEAIDEANVRNSGGEVEGKIVTHLFGIPVKINNPDGIPIIEDCAQTIEEVGDKGDISIFSFGYDKPISAGGGGMIVCNNPKYIQAIDWLVDEKMTQLQSLVALEQLRKIETLNWIRRRNVTLLIKLLNKKKWEFEEVVVPSIRFPIYGKPKEIKGYDIRGWNKIPDLMLVPTHEGISEDDIKEMAKQLNG